MKNKKRDYGVFQAANDIDAGKLPKRNDAAEYIQYLRGTLEYMIHLTVRQEQELESLRGKKQYTWTPTSDGAKWTTATSKEE